jgi:hypothetical protein
VDRCVGRVRCVEKLEELDELVATIAILDQGVNLAGEQSHARQHVDRAMGLDS